MTIRKRAKGRSTKFRSEALREKPERVDRNAKVILGYAVMTIGEAKGHGVEIDSETIDQTVELGQATGDRGLKTRFTHPNMSSDGMGTFLGRSKNFRRDGDKCRADLHLSPRAFDGPRGDLGSYVLDLAESDPDMFGSSVVITYKLGYRLNEDGTRQRDKEGEPLPPLVRLEKLHACDIVDEPAANEGLFSEADETHPDYPARAATAVLDRLFGSDSPDVVRERVDDFLNRYLSNREDDPMSKDKDSAKPVAIDPRVKAALLGIKLIPTADASDEICTAVLSSFFTLREQDQPAGVDELLAALQAKPEKKTPPTAKEPLQEKDPPADPLAAARLAEKTRVTEITAFCALAGFPEKADRYIDKDFSAAEVQAELFSAVCKRNTPVGDEGGTGGEGKPDDPDAKYKAEYKAEQAIYQRAGISEEQYCASRRIDDGLAELAPAGES